jgi:D-alanyl-lipoteichoic acid acyltransferase DltB (MBOAT superfamily)
LPGRTRWVLLLLASIFFYISAGAEAFIIPVLIILSTFTCGILIAQTSNEGRKKTYFRLGLFINLGLLVFFKYINFLIKTFLDGFYFINHFIRAGQTQNQASIVLQLIVPLGISYITFQAIGYLIEIIRGNHDPEKNLGLFAAYILFFPKLLAGPIERAHNFLPQLRQQHPFNSEQVVLGLKLITWGLFRKLVVADRIAIYTDAVFNNYTHHSGITIFVTIILFAIQLYADFSGYTEIAIGSARLFGFDLMQNFNRPFLAKNVSDFWRRWHISLSTWVSDYIYFPAVLDRRDWRKFGVSYALLISFAIIGIWHGPSWNFLIFGLLQAFALIFEVFTVSFREKIAKAIPSVIYENLSILLTFLYISFSFVFFRTPGFNDAINIISRVFTAHGGFFIMSPTTLIFAALGIVMLIFYEVQNEYKYLKIRFFSNEHWFVQQIAYAILVIAILMIGVFDGSQFIYFQF